MFNFMKKIRFPTFTLLLASIFFLSTKVATAQVDIPEPTPPPRAISKAFGLDPFYQQWIDVGGMPVLASAKVNSYAVKEAAYLINQMIGHRQDILQAMAEDGVRFSVMAHNELTTQIPEHSHLRPKFFNDHRSRGLGGQTTTCGEENLLNYQGDPYWTENVLIHEFAHTLHTIGLNTVDPSFDVRLRIMYEAALEAGLWQGTYASTNHHEYWAEGTQSWFNVNEEHGPLHNHVNTRRELRDYDPDLAALLIEVYGDRRWRYTPPATRTHLPHLQGFNPEDSPTFEWPPDLIELYYQLENSDSDGSGEWVNLPPHDPSELASLNGPRTIGGDTEILLVNFTGIDVLLYHVDSDGTETFHARQSQDIRSFGTNAGDIWLLKDENDDDLAVFRAEKKTGRILVERELLGLPPAPTFVENELTDSIPGPKIEGPWLWMIAPTGKIGGSEAAASGIDWLAEVSNNSVTEQQVATSGVTAGDEVGNRVWTLRELSATDEDNINKVMNATGLGTGNIEYHVAYGYISLDSPDEQNTRMFVGSDDAVKVWLNGVLVHDNPVNRGATDYQEDFPVTLKQGTNILLVAVYELWGGWSGFFGFENDAVYSLVITPVVQVGASERPPMYWINVKSGTLHRLVGAEVENLVPNVRNATGLAMDVTGSKLYWTERTGDSTGRIRRANLDGRNVQLVKNLTSVPHDIALDAANGKIYVTNAWGKVQRLDVDGSNFQPNLITGLERPSGLALDVSGGKVYWAETTGRIRRANLDGSNVEDVATGLGPPISIAIFDNTVYWTEKIDENSGEIRFVNLQGNVVTRNSFTQGFPIGIAVDSVENKLYWTTSHGKIGRQNLDGSNFQPNFVTGLSAPGTLALRVETPVDVETPVVAATDAVVSISPSPVISPAVGERLTLNLKITAGEAVAGYQFIVRFDPTALRYVESGNGEYLPTGAFFVQPVVNRDRVELAATALAGVSNGDGTLATITFEVMAVKPSTLTLSEPLFADDQGNTFLPRVEGGEITEPPELKGDVNADGVVNIQDLVLVASSFGETGENSADINADGVVNIADLVLVAGALGATAAAPSIQAESLKLLTAADVRQWLSQAHRLNSSHVDYQRGLLVLEQLLAALAPKETSLLPNYPNPFNPETWIPYQLATSGDVKITIYDARGIVVRRLELGYRQAGYYTHRSRSAYWDGCNALGEHVASGLYFYHLEAEGVSLLRKMVTLK